MAVIRNDKKFFLMTDLGLIRKYQDMLELYARSLLCPYASPERSHVQTKDFHAINR